LQSEPADLLRALNPIFDQRVSVVTPTLRRPQEVRGLLDNLRQQEHLPFEVILVDGAPAGEDATATVVSEEMKTLPFAVRYIRKGGGTAIQRNAGIDAANGDFIAFIDDDVRLEADFFRRMLIHFGNDKEKKVGGIVGYRTNKHFNAKTAERWGWYRRLRLLTTFEPGRYDYACGYPINNNMQPPFSGVREVDFMTTACAVWRREVTTSGLRFDPFFRDYGILEDAHFSLRAGRGWKLWQSGDAHCVELSSPNARENRRKIGYKCVVNYYYVFREIVQPLTWRHKFRFWRYQAFELFRIGTSAIRRKRINDLMEFYGRIEGAYAVARSRDV
jgi:glycosyltransferase involved in cell wall biosynthesis